MVAQDSGIPDGPVRLFDVARMAVAVAVLDAQGVVVGWTAPAARLLGYQDKEVLGHPAVTLLAQPEDRAAAVAAARDCRTHDGWEGTVTVRHRDGRRLALALRAVAVRDPAGGRQWALLARDERRARGAELSRMMMEPLLTYSPVGVAVMDTDLRYVWVNEVLTYGGAIPRERRLGRRPSEVLPAEHGERLERELWRVLETGVPVLNYEYVAPTPANPSRQGSWWTCIFRL